MSELPSEVQEDDNDQQRFEHERRGPTVCATCYYAPSNARYTAWWEWQCQADRAKLPATFNFVTGQTVADPPRLRCKVRNTGQCADYREAQNIFGLKIAKEHAR